MANASKPNKKKQSKLTDLFKSITNSEPNETKIASDNDSLAAEVSASDVSISGTCTGKNYNSLEFSSNFL